MHKYKKLILILQITRWDNARKMVAHNEVKLVIIYK